MRQSLLRVLLASVCGAGILVVVFVLATREEADGQSAGRGVPQRKYATLNLSNLQIRRNEIHSGGPGKDGIPSLTNPKFVPAAQAAFMKPDDRVAGVVIDGAAKAYPLKILDFHEAVNYRIGDVSFAVTYCPLCDSAAVFDRRLKDRTVELGISGLLYNSNVLLYDRKHPSGEVLISQLARQEISGATAGTELTLLPLELTTWRDWAERYPQTLVLSPQTGHQRDYSGRVYAEYFRSPRLMFPVSRQDNRLPAKMRVLGVTAGDASRAYPITAFDGADAPVGVRDELGGKHITLRFDPEHGSLRVVEADEDVEWLYSFWFAWAAFHPDTDVYQPRS